jgi:hypothetical protein
LSATWTRTRPATAWSAEDVDVAALTVDGFSDTGLLIRTLDRYGVCIARGLDIGRGSLGAAEVVMALAERFGTIHPQDRSGSRWLDVIDAANAHSLPPGAHARGVGNNHAVALHTENDGEPTPPRLVFFGCLEAAEVGGASTIASARHVHDVLGRLDPRALALLHRPISFGRRPDDYDESVTDTDPVFRCGPQALMMRYSRYWIDRAESVGGRPLSRGTRGALDLLDRTLQHPQTALVMVLRPGDVLVIDNQAVLHGRQAFRDGRASRHLVRVWVD